MRSLALKNLLSETFLLRQKNDIFLNLKPTVKVMVLSGFFCYCKLALELTSRWALDRRLFSFLSSRAAGFASMISSEERKGNKNQAQHY